MNEEVFVTSLIIACSILIGLCSYLWHCKSNYKNAYVSRGLEAHKLSMRLQSMEEERSDLLNTVQKLEKELRHGNPYINFDNLRFKFSDTNEPVNTVVTIKPVRKNKVTIGNEFTSRVLRPTSKNKKGYKKVPVRPYILPRIK